MTARRSRSSIRSEARRELSGKRFARACLHIGILAVTAVSAPACFTMLLYGKSGGDYFSTPDGIYTMLERAHGNVDATYASSSVKHSVDHPTMVIEIKDSYSHEDLFFSRSNLTYRGPYPGWRIQVRNTTEYRGLKAVDEDTDEALEDGDISMKKMEAVDDGAWLVLPGAGIAVHVGSGPTVPLYVGPELPAFAPGTEALRATDGTIRIGERLVLRPHPIAAGDSLIFYDTLGDAFDPADAEPARTVALRPGDHYLQLRRRLASGGKLKHLLSLYRMPAPTADAPPRIYVANADLAAGRSVKDRHPGAWLLQGVVIAITPVFLLADLAVSPLYALFIARESCLGR